MVGWLVCLLAGLLVSKGAGCSAGWLVYLLVRAVVGLLIDWLVGLLVA